MSWRMRRRLLSVAFYALLAVVLLYVGFPFYWAVVSSLKTGPALFGTDLLPPIDLTNYASVLGEGPFLGNLLNSVLVATAVVAISLTVSITASYALGRLRFRGRRTLLLTIVFVSMFPQIVVLSGLFGTIRALGLYNTLWSLVLAYMIFTLPFTVWVLTTFMREMPRELDDAARVDGCTAWQTITRIYLPLMGPALASTGLLAFIAAWNEFLFALTFTLSDDVRTVPVAIAMISGASRYELPFGGIMAGAVIVTAPLIVLVLVFQRRIVSGLTAGAVKG